MQRGLENGNNDCSKKSHLNWLNINWLSFHGFPNIKYKHYSKIYNLYTSFLYIILKVALSLVSEETKA